MIPYISDTSRTSHTDDFKEKVKYEHKKDTPAPNKTLKDHHLIDQVTPNTPGTRN